MSNAWDVYSLTTTTHNGGGSFALAPSGSPHVAGGVLSSADHAGSLAFSTTGDTRIADIAFALNNHGDGTYEGSITVAGVAGYVISYVDFGPLLFVPAGSNVRAGGTGTLNTATVLDACFAAGTLIRTPDGRCAVENLRPGDLVLTVGGEARPVLWLGRGTVPNLFADPVRRLPIRIKAGALGEKLPARDLVVSPGHAILLNGALVQASVLVNGTSIVRDLDAPATFIYYHVELAAHDLLLAEGVLAESFLIGVEDMEFDNWAERPAGLPVARELPHPRVKTVRQLPASVRALVAGRAAVIAGSLRCGVDGAGRAPSSGAYARFAR